jgi:hypothetical protein
MKMHKDLGQILMGIILDRRSGGPLGGGDTCME